MTSNEEQARQPEPGERTAQEMLKSIETAKRLIEAAKAQRQTKADGYIGYVVV